MTKQVEWSLDTYDLLFYFPIPHWEPADDGFRSNEKARRILLDAIIVANLTHSGRTYHTVPDGNPNYRAGWVLEIIQRLHSGGGSRLTPLGAVE
jgi:hypothetical protein